MISEGDQHHWQVWADALHRWGIGDWAAAFLESVGPFSILGAQFLFMSKPFLGQAASSGQLDAAARILENSHLQQAFIRLLREGSSQ